jgi:hypothetical protein
MVVVQNLVKYIKLNKMQELIKELKDYKQFSMVIDIDFVIVLIQNYLNEKNRPTEVKKESTGNIQ